MSTGIAIDGALEVVPPESTEGRKPHSIGRLEPAGESHVVEAIEMAIVEVELLTVDAGKIEEMSMKDWLSNQSLQFSVRRRVKTVIGKYQEYVSKA